MEPGQTVAVVGPSGAGKSTIGRLLFRFYDVTGGAVLIDGQDVRDVTQASLRAQIGMVPQDTVLFNDTIYYNIAYGRPEASREEVEAAARAAQIHDFIAPPAQGLRHHGGRAGAEALRRREAAGGDRADAAEGPADPRCSTRRPAHSTARPSAGSRRACAAMGLGRSVIIIAHRLSTVVDADRIVVLEHGRVVEQGTHEALLARAGAMRGCGHRQQSEPESADDAGAGRD